VTRPWIIGGPAYRRQLAAEHAVSVAELSWLCGAHGQPLSYGYLHGCPPEQPRNVLFERALASPTSVLIWLDSDCFLPDVHSVYRLATLLTERLDPFVGGPYVLGDGERCSIADEGSGWRPVAAIAELAARGEPERVHAMGLGLALFNLDRYRGGWTSAPWFRTQWAGGTLESEDHWHTSQLLERFGAQALAWHRPIVEHLVGAR
jgi:hypothetical protein